MPPELAVNNELYKTLRDTILVSKSQHSYSTVSVPLANLSDLLFGEFHLMMRFTFRTSLAFKCVASFTDHICRIVFGGAKKQMIRTHARRIVAGVAYIKFTGRNAIMQFVRNTSSSNNLAASTAGLDDTISAVGFGTSPIPAPIGFVDVSPEPLGKTSALTTLWGIIALVHRNLPFRWTTSRLDVDASDGFLRFPYFTAQQARMRGIHGGSQ